MSALRYRVEVRVPGAPADVVVKAREVQAAVEIQRTYRGLVVENLAALRQQAALAGRADPYPEGITVAIVDTKTGRDL